MQVANSEMNEWILIHYSCDTMQCCVLRMVPKRKTGVYIFEDNSKRKSFTLEVKHKIIHFAEGGMKTREITSKINLAHTTARTIIKNEERILADLLCFFLLVFFFFLHTKYIYM